MTAAGRHASAIGLLGGTFDPVHIGHLRLAIEVRELLGLAGMRLLPAGAPNLRAPPEASSGVRVRMLQAAIAHDDALAIDPREVGRDGTSYTVDTLAALRSEVGDAPLLFLMGADAFATLPRWHRWRELLDYAHLVVVSRPESAAPDDPDLDAMLDSAWCDDAQALLFAPGGRIVFQPIPLLPVSSTDIRARVRAGRSIRHLVPEPVRDIIINDRLYR